MKRKPGFYHVQWAFDTPYVIAKWNGEYFQLCGALDKYYETSFFRIHETQIPCPSE